MCPISRHGICRCHSTQSNRSFISTFISHYAHRLYRQQDNSCLPYFIIQSPVTQSLDEDIVSILQNTYFSGVISPKIRTASPGPGTDDE